MSPSEFSVRLSDARHSKDFLAESEFAVDDLPADMGAQDGLSYVEEILRFMEKNPSLDYGVPGPLVHFAEKFYGAGYEDKLLASLNRHPITHTTWMLNRIINGTKDSDTRKSLVSMFMSIENHPMSDPKTKELAAHFFSKQM